MKFLRISILFIQFSFGLVIDDFQNLSLGKSWKYATKSGGYCDCNQWDSDSTNISLAVTGEQLFPDSSKYEISFLVENIFHRMGQFLPNDTTVDTVYPPTSFRYSCTKYVSTGLSTCRDTLGQITAQNGIFTVFRPNFITTRQFGVQDYPNLIGEKIIYKADTLDYFQIRDTVRGSCIYAFSEASSYVDSIGYVFHGSTCASYIGSSSYMQTLIEFNSEVFNVGQLVPLGIQFYRRYSMPGILRIHNHDALGRSGSKVLKSKIFLSK